MAKEIGLGVADGISISLLVSGDKGFNLLSDLPRARQLVDVVCYDQGSCSARINHFEAEAAARGASFRISNRPDSSTLCGDIVFAAGWQHLIPAPPSNLVVLHDSLLPKYRGFASTVASLLAGDKEIGVSALIPVDEAVAGPILAQSAVSIEYPIRIREALNALRECYVTVVEEVCGQFARNRALVGQPQTAEKPSISQWRDLFDYAVDWESSSIDVQRHIHAVSEPYDGAVVSTFDGNLYRLCNAAVVEDVEIAGRQS